jgi:hypothetical protein
MKKLIQIGGMGLLMSLATVAAQAHHSFAAEYDSQKVIQLTGTVTKVEWQNPHVYIYADVVNDKGQVTPWAFEMGAPAVLTRTLGWTRSTLNVGDVISVEGRGARDGSNLANARTITLSNGQKLGAGSSENVQY